jgi:hypothetical protein
MAALRLARAYTDHDSRSSKAATTAYSTGTWYTPVEMAPVEGTASRTLPASVPGMLRALIRLADEQCRSLEIFGCRPQNRRAFPSIRCGPLFDLCATRGSLHAARQLGIAFPARNHRRGQDRLSGARGGAKRDVRSRSLHRLGDGQWLSISVLPAEDIMQRLGQGVVVHRYRSILRGGGKCLEILRKRRSPPSPSTGLACVRASARY